MIEIGEGVRCAGDVCFILICSYDVIDYGQRVKLVSCGLFALSKIRVNLLTSDSGCNVGELKEKLDYRCGVV